MSLVDATMMHILVETLIFLLINTRNLENVIWLEYADTLGHFEIMLVWSAKDHF